MKVALTYLLLFFIFSILFVLPPILFPFPQAPEGQVNALMFFLLLLVDFVSLVYLISRINLTGMKLFLAVTLVFWGLQTFMTQIETWYFREAMSAITNTVLLKLFINPFVTAVTFIPLAIWMLGKWKQTNGHHPPSLKSKWKEILALSVTYMVIYYLFGYYVAWQFAEVRTFYSGSPEILGFFQQFQNTLHIHPFLLPFQVFRGFLWILCGLPLVLYLKGTNTEKIVACVFMFSILTSIQLIIDNPFMPSEVRMAHLLEVSTSNGLFGLLIGLFLGSGSIKSQPESR